MCKLDISIADSPAWKVLAATMLAAARGLEASCRLARSFLATEGGCVLGNYFAAAVSKG